VPIHCHQQPIDDRRYVDAASDCAGTARDGGARGGGTRSGGAGAFCSNGQDVQVPRSTGMCESGLVAQMSEDFVDDVHGRTNAASAWMRRSGDRLIFDAGDNLDWAATAGASFHINVEHALQPLRPSHGSMVFGR
jgi:hypothetical protein